ncbi:MAG: phosphate ABC transporter permease [Lentisphaerae bacterium RIFOXYC12_FULL_60_16]|nr:MAG: phosphate ABC transporter permease [Lentisphaerae bacterium RIFOXYC12_FULL_60_16]
MPDSRILNVSRDLVLSRRASQIQRLTSLLGRSFLFMVTSVSVLAVLFIIIFITRDAFPFFQIRGFREFFTSTHWFPSGNPPEFGALSIITGSALVAMGAAIVAVPLGVLAAVCLSDVLPFSLRQVAKPIIEILAAIPSVAYGFFALVIFAPALQEHGGIILTVCLWMLALPAALLAATVISDLVVAGIPTSRRPAMRGICWLTLVGGALFALVQGSGHLLDLTISSGTNALNVSIILGIMALPTVVSVSEDALQAVGRDLREGSYALGATRAETLVKTIIPAAASGIAAASILGIMRAVGETMVVWMASGNAAQIPTPWYNLLQPVRTLTATIAGDMGEADHVLGSARYHVLFAMALSLLLFSFGSNFVSEHIGRKFRSRQAGG